jgi:hypothetical protein
MGNKLKKHESPAAGLSNWPAHRPIAAVIGISHAAVIHNICPLVLQA